QRLPPCGELDAGSELSPCAPKLSEIATAYALPSGPIETQGSDARSKLKPPGAQALKGSVVSPQVRPLLNEKPATRPWAPPKLFRSCCQTPTTLPALAGLTATQGSTSALT